ncbi:hypothetical protein [Sutterella sp.]|uniref:hypothetical protein n=1 Tax=Sutterella sp. TaxID=1981025 RepID=UPI0026DED0AA|nr:hypothetical protein [Sutterella sp.]MDO5532663.1 hypothetical protein [Sutterella sp.]
MRELSQHRRDILLDFAENASGVRQHLTEIFGGKDAGTVLQLIRFLNLNREHKLIPAGEEVAAIFPGGDAEASLVEFLGSVCGREDLERAFMERRIAALNPGGRQLLAFEHILWDLESTMFDGWRNILIVYTMDFEVVGYSVPLHGDIGPAPFETAVESFGDYNPRPCFVSPSFDDEAWFHYFLRGYHLPYLLLDCHVPGLVATGELSNGRPCVAEGDLAQQGSEDADIIETDIHLPFSAGGLGPEPPFHTRVRIDPIFDVERSLRKCRELSAEVERRLHELNETDGTPPEEDELADVFVQQDGAWRIDEFAFSNLIRRQVGRIHATNVDFSWGEIYDIKRAWEDQTQDFFIWDEDEVAYFDKEGRLEQSPALRGRLFVEFAAECVSAHVMRRFRAVVDRLGGDPDPVACEIRKILPQFNFFDFEDLNTLGHLSDAAFERLRKEFVKPLQAG